ncbi:MAG TPA: ABC transporter ATP-binding protein [Candidatus Nanoarchaeia archaeon]
MNETVLEVKNLVKDFDSFQVLKSISFAIPRGKVVGLLGPNGAGKTTTINILLGITRETSGQIWYFGRNFFKNKQGCLQKMNFASSFNTLQGRISVWENLLVFSYLYSLKNPEKKIKELSTYFEITHLLPKRFWDLSSGEKTRVNLIKSLLNEPELLLMDEPTASLDPDIADKTLSLIENLRKNKNISILYTSHNMDDVTRICDEVIFLDKGKIVAHDTPLGLTKRITKTVLKLTFDGDKNALENFLKEQKQICSFPHPYTVLMNTKEKTIPKLIFGISNLGIWITDIEVEKPTLEDVFLRIARGEK